MGTKQAALKGSPERYLQNFGDDFSPSSFKDAEKYLIVCTYPNSKSINFDDLGYELYLTKNKPISELPPTSHSIEGHLMHCYYIINTSINLLESFQLLDPRNYGWKETHNGFLPERFELPLPDNYFITCGCVEGCTLRCVCNKRDVYCTEFCKCSSYYYGGNHN